MLKNCYTNTINPIERAEATMKKYKLLIAFLLIFTLPQPMMSAAIEDKREYILTFSNKEQATYYALQHEFPQDGSYVKATLSPEEIPQLKQTFPLIRIEANFIKEVTSAGTDPLRVKQWNLDSVGFSAIEKQFSERSSNSFVGSKFTNGNQSFTYSGGSVPFQQFTILHEVPIRRISVQINNNQGVWTLKVKDRSGKVLGTTSSTLHQNDVVLWEPLEKGEITIEVSSEDGWIPSITNVIGVNHSVIGVIDTGISQHEDFGHNILTSLGKDFVEGDSFPQDENGHGTHVTGIIAAAAGNKLGVAGVVGNGPVDIIPLRAMDANGRGTDFELSQAIREAIQLGADIINLSVSGKGRTIMLENSIYEAFQNDVIVVAAAGNNNSSLEYIYPASYPGVITVIGTNTNQTRMDQSNFGWEAEISAPGTNILSTYINNEYVFMSGTSMATPTVSGILALYKNQFSNLDWIRARELIESNAKDLHIPGFDPETGYGFIQYTDSPLIPNRTVEWLSMKPGKPVTQPEQVLGFSEDVMGKEVHIFINEQFYMKQTINDFLMDITLPSYTVDRKNNSLLALVISGDKVIGHHHVRAKPASLNNSFTDIPPSHWAYDSINTAASYGWIHGYENGSFEPLNTITRRHTVMMLDQMLEWSVPSSIASPYSDVPSTLPGYLSVIKGAEKSVIKGYPDGSFQGDKPLLRGQMAIILTRLLNGEVPKEQAEIHHFQDLKMGSEEYRAAQWLTSHGIFTKRDKFYPFEPMTRAQFASVLVRVWEQFFK